MKSVGIQELDFEKGGGLVPIVTQDATSREVLMVAYANKEAVEMTVQTGYAHYWSRSRQELWKKGATSGHLQKITQVLADCDNDTVLYLVEQTGPACHTGERSCFHRCIRE
jgi:phosphoribosyl-AMP cyclohydrolase